jgi:uncharacterized protein (TIGR02246 family)
MDESVLATVTTADEQAIRDLVAQVQALQNDREGLLELHAPGVVIVNLAGRRVLGRQAFSEAMAGALASPLRDVKTTIEILDIRLAAPDTAIVSCRKTVHDGRSAADASNALPATGALTYVLTRIGGSWRIALAQTTPILGPS